MAAVVLLLLVVWSASRRGDPGSSGASPTIVAGSSNRPSGRATPSSRLATVAESKLPTAARSMLVRIHAGGPFRYTEDGQTFGNREGLLPKRPRGYYKEYTVKPGSTGDRGPLRIIGGTAGDLYWTSDHYAHFAQIKEGQ